MSPITQTVICAAVLAVAGGYITSQIVGASPPPCDTAAIKSRVFAVEREMRGAAANCLERYCVEDAFKTGKQHLQKIAKEALAACGATAEQKGMDLAPLENMARGQF